jgi:glutamate dehydrogenase
VLGSGLGVLRKDSVTARGLSTGPDVDPLARNLLILTQASAPATVYRPVYPHYIGVKIFDERGAVSGEHRGDSGVPTRPDVRTITERLEDAVRTWEDRLLDAALTSGVVGADLARRYLAAFTQAYKEDFDAATALADICRLEALAAADGLDLCFDLSRGAMSGEGRLTLYLARRRITLSQVLPVLQQMDVEVVDERPYQVIRSDGAHCWIYDFALRLDATLLAQVAGQDIQDVQRRFCDAFVAAWRGACEVDGFNALVLRAGLDWRQAAVLRGYVRYLRQAGSPYS